MRGLTMSVSGPILFSDSRAPRTALRPLLFALAAAAALLLLAALDDDSKSLLLIVAAIAMPAILICGVIYTSHHHEWLIFPLALICLVIQASFFGEHARAAFHYLALALFCLPAAPRVLQSRILRTGGFRLYVLYFGWAAVTVAYSLAPVYSLARLIDSILVMIGVAACALEIHEPADVTRILLRFLLACAIVLAIMVAAAPILPHDVAWLSPFESYTPDELANMAKAGIIIGGLDRFRGLFNGPNDIGAFMLVVVGLAAACWRTAKGRERVMLAAAIAAAVALDVLADSRSAFVAIALGASLLVIWRWRVAGFLLCAAASIAVALVMLRGGMFAYVGRDVTTLTGRTDIWIYIVQKIREQPILGYGYETAGAVYESRYFPIWWGPWDMGPHSSLHNGYLGHLIGVGIPATALWLYIVLRTWIFVLRQPDDPWNLKPIFFLIAVPILINNVSEQMLGDFGGGLVALLFGLTWAIAERYRLRTLREREADRAAALAALPKAVSALASA
jgi:O-antigen ligase